MKGHAGPWRSPRPQKPITALNLKQGSRAAVTRSHLFLLAVKPWRPFILAHERNDRNAYWPDHLPALQRERVAVISRYVKINPEDHKVQL